MNTLNHPTAPSTWWSGFFDQIYAEFGLANVDTEVNESVASFLIDKPDLSEGDRALDQCCGCGRLSLVLAKRGIEVTGIDQAQAYVDQATSRIDGRTMSQKCSFRQADAMEFVTPEPCDGIFNWFTSFGYSEDDTVNIKMIQRAIESLRSGGRYILDYQNIPRIFSEFMPGRVMRSPSPNQQEMIVIAENTPDFARGMLRSTWTFLHSDGLRDSRDVFTRLFMPHEIVKMFEQAGFVKVELFGSADGDPFTRKSKRCIVLGSKP